MYPRSVLTLLATLAAATPALAAEHVVQMKFNEVTGQVYYDKPRLVIQPGDTVTWVQVDPVNEHNVAAYPDRIPEGTNPFESPMMKKPGEKWSITFAKPGTYEYHCHPHEAAKMRGVVIVGRESAPGEFRKARPGEMQHDHGGAGGHGDHGQADHGSSHTQNPPAASGGDGHSHAPGTPAHRH